MGKRLWSRFRDWDRQRKFGCEFGDFLFLLVVMFVVGFVCIVVVDTLASYVFFGVVVAVCECLMNRSTPY